MKQENFESSPPCGDFFLDFFGISAQDNIGGSDMHAQDGF